MKSTVLLLVEIGFHAIKVRYHVQRKGAGILALSLGSQGVSWTRLNMYAHQICMERINNCDLEYRFGS